MNKQYVLTHRGYEIYQDKIAFMCPRLNLFGFASENALLRAMNRKLQMSRRAS